MFQNSKSHIKNILPYFKGLFRSYKSRTPKDTPTMPRLISPAMPVLSTEKQQELDKLCQQLFKKKELITSGKLQLIGLEKIKEGMGERWEKLSTLVYATSEDVINQHIGKGDFFIRYQGNSYVIIFAHATRQEAQTKADLIITGIKQRLFNLNEADLKGIEIRGTVEEIKASHFAQKGFPQVLETVFTEIKPPVVRAASNPVSSNSTNQNPDQHQSTSTMPKPANKYAYVPLWDVAHGALTTYICMPQFSVANGENIFDAYQASYLRGSASDRLEIDLNVLNAVINELISMEEDNRKLFVICPVHQETLSHLENFKIYKDECQQIPVAQRKFLIFMIIDMPDGIALKEPYRFIGPLKNFCVHVFAKHTLGHKINFQILKDSGIEGAGVVASIQSQDEGKIMQLLNSFCAEAQASKIAKTFVLGVTSLSVTTSAVCAGYGYLGGSGIHEDVVKPDHVYRYKHEDLITGLLK